MSVPRDLRVTMRYLTASEATRQGVPNAQPGFYVEAFNNEGYGTIVKLTRVPAFSEVENIARTIDRAIPGRADGHYPVMRAVLNLRTQHERDAIERRRHAEAQIAAAQATLAALDAGD